MEKEGGVKININYFSGTGNTAWAVRRLVEHLIGLGEEVMAASRILDVLARHHLPRFPGFTAWLADATPL